jgi:hypothetical protein
MLTVKDSYSQDQCGDFGTPRGLPAMTNERRGQGPEGRRAGKAGQRPAFLPAVSQVATADTPVTAEAASMQCSREIMD